MDTRSTSSRAHRPRGLRAIIAYKVVKAALVLPLAIVLTIAPHGAAKAAWELIRDLAEGGAAATRLAAWLGAHVSERTIVEGAVVAWVDGLTTGLEGFLLYRGTVWGEWVVIGTLALLLPVELVMIGKHPSVAKVAALAVNASVVAYLVHRRLKERRR
jgi:uncharacterized membrane protein (DUF2068 family)